MLTIFPFSSLMLSCILMSTFMAISSSNWLMLWLALEINMMSFIPFLMSTKTNHELESAIKYFLIQGLGSSLVLVFSTSMWFMNMSSEMISSLLMISLLIKVGAAPFYFWYPQVMSGANWLSCLLLSTWQKLAPLFMLGFMFQSHKLLFIVAAITAFIGGLSGMNQVKLRSLMAYSSLTHLGWMVGLIYYNSPLSMVFYFLLYFIIILPLFVMFYSMNMSYISFSANSIKLFMMLNMMMLLLLMSLSGMPPLTGFLPKWMAISMMASIPQLLLILIISSLMSTFYYMNLFFSSFMSFMSSTYDSLKMPLQTWMMIPVSCMMLFPIPLCLIM